MMKATAAVRYQRAEIEALRTKLLIMTARARGAESINAVSGRNLLAAEGRLLWWARRGPHEAHCNWQLDQTSIEGCDCGGRP